MIALLLPATLMFGPAASDASVSPSSALFAAQAKTAHLTASQQTMLQSEVNNIIARYGGRQVALNEIALPHDSSLLFPLPGQRRAHVLPGTPSLPVPEAKVAQAARAPNSPAWSVGQTWVYEDDLASCPFYYFCSWQGRDYGGEQFNVSECNIWQEYPGYGWTGDGSWVNNQSFGLEAYLSNQSQTTFLGIDPNYAGSGPNWADFFNWYPWWYVMACYD